MDISHSKESTTCNRSVEGASIQEETRRSAAIKLETRLLHIHFADIPNAVVALRFLDDKESDLFVPLLLDVLIFNVPKRACSYTWSAATTACARATAFGLRACQQCQGRATQRVSICYSCHLNLLQFTIPY